MEGAEIMPLEQKHLRFNSEGFSPEVESLEC